VIAPSERVGWWDDTLAFTTAGRRAVSRETFSYAVRRRRVRAGARATAEPDRTPERRRARLEDRRDQVLRWGLQAESSSPLWLFGHGHA
jgi:hypothetical protein